MKLVKLEISADEAAEILQGIEARLQAKQAQRVVLDSEIKALETRVNNMREQLNGHTPPEARKPKGSNKQLIVDFLKTVPSAKPVEIHRATGIARSSVPFTLKEHEGTLFECDKATGSWKLK